MMVRGRLVFALLVSLLVCAGASAMAQTVGAAVGESGRQSSSAPGVVTGSESVKVSFDFANPALTPALWQIEFGANGVGHYHSQPGESSPPDAAGVVPQAFDQQIEISTPVREQIFAIARSHHFFTAPCESRHKVAFTGSKTVRYAGPDGQGSCTYNWSQDAQMMKVADMFIAISTTLEEGRKLRLEYLHDRLSLDAELETLTANVKSGNAIELENIAPELRAIAGDEGVMKRAQARAAALLATLPAAEGERASIQPR